MKMRRKEKEKESHLGNINIYPERIWDMSRQIVRNLEEKQESKKIKIHRKEDQFVLSPL